ncbi:MAG: DUF3796 domain-containing protein [Bacillota bacterium]
MKLKRVSPFAFLGLLGILGVLGSIEGQERLGLLGLFGLFALFAVRWDERFRGNLALAGRNAFLVALIGVVLAGSLILLEYPASTVYPVVIGLFPVMITVFVAFLLGYETRGR